MNSLIENLNQWGATFLTFAWPMLWQSSLLFAIVLALEFLLARRIRAAVRYALWLAVLVKLLLPPTLALPTGAAWWLFQNQPEIKIPAAKNFTVSYDNAMPPMEFVPSNLPLPAPLPPKLERTGWLLLTVIAVSVALLLWLAVRWWQVARMVRRAKPSLEFSEPLAEAMRLAGAPSTSSASYQKKSQRAELVLGAPVRLKIVEGAMSPAVCGLFRPVILLPRALAEKLSAAQLRAVLLHEIFHLRRWDVWVNCAQALLQIFYWWHPLLWVANARIRRVREEAVDDAVMLALRDEAETYAPTLLEVAKLALRRPLMSLGLVGIMESRSALRQRIERLVDFRAPRKAGLTFASLCGIFVFSAVALPMGEAPGKIQTNGVIKVENENSIPTNSNRDTTGVDNTYIPVNTVSAAPQTVFEKTNPPQVLIQAEIYRMRQTDFEKLVSDPAFVQTKQNKVENFKQFNRLVKSSGFKPVSRPRIVANSGTRAQFYMGTEIDSIELECLPIVTNGLIDLTSRFEMISTITSGKATNELSNHAIFEKGGGHVFSIKLSDDLGGSNTFVVTIRPEIVTKELHFQPQMKKFVMPAGSSPTNSVLTSPARRALLSKLQNIRLESFSSTNLPLVEVVKQLSEQSRLRDPERKGINFLITPNLDQSGQVSSSVSGGAVGEKVDIATAATVTVNLTNVSLADVLDIVVVVANHPDGHDLKYSIKDFGVEFADKGAEIPLMFTRYFKVEANIFLDNLAMSAKVNRVKVKVNSPDKYAFMTPAASPQEVAQRVRSVFTNAGVNLDTPPGKAVFYNDRSGILMMRATEADLEVIEPVIQKLNYTAPQIHIKARFVEVPKGTLGGFTKFLMASNQATGQFTGILNGTNTKSILRALEKVKGVETLGEPEVVTTSGRQAQMRSTEIVTVITNMLFQETWTNQNGVITSNSIVPQTAQIETGPILDVVPYVLSDGYTINLALIPSLTEFLGYDEPTNTTTMKKIKLPVVMPRFSVRQIVTTLNLWDGQTAIISGLQKKNYVSGKEVSNKLKSSDKDLLIFVTATIVDPAGNRVHTEGELPFAQNKIPPQPPTTK